MSSMVLQYMYHVGISVVYVVDCLLAAVGCCFSFINV